MKLPKLAVRNPVTTFMAMCLVLLLGFVSLTGLRLDLMPNINPPVIAVMTQYPGAGPEEVAEMVTKPLEEIVGTSSGLEMLQSRSSSNSSLIIAQYAWGTNISEIREDLTTSLGLIQLPDGVGSPMLVKFDPTMMPIIQVAVSNGEDVSHLQQLVDEEIIPQLQSIRGVASVNVTGGFDEEIVVSLDEAAMRERGLSQAQIVQLIQGNDLTFPGGMVENVSEKLNLRILAKVDSMDELKSLPVSVVPSGQELSIVTLDEIANVSLAQKDITSVARTNGKESLLISIQKEAEANTVEVSRLVQDRLDSIIKGHSDLRFTVSMNQGDIIEQSVNNVMLALIAGGIFAVMVILVFLRSIKSTLIVGIAIPFSVIATFVLMYFTGMTLNIMSLGGLALGVGMLVDNAIVVIENIYRHLSQGKSRTEAAITGTSEVGGAVTASMLTTLSVFVPIVFIGGMVGDLFKELALTVTFSLLGSWIVALTVVPMFAAILLKVSKIKKQRESRTYKKIITWALDHRIGTLFLTVIVLVSALVVAPRIGTEFMPAQDEGMFIVNIELPVGATLNRTVEAVRSIEDELLKLSEVDLVTTAVGNDDAMMAAVTGSSENSATITVKLVSQSERTRKTDRIMKDFEGQIKKEVDPEVSITVSESSSMEAMSGAPSQMEVMLLGNNTEQLAEYSKELTERLLKESIFRKVSDSVQEGKPEYQFIVNKHVAMKHGLTSYQIATFINQSLQGTVATTLFDTEVRVITKGISNSIEAIENLKMETPFGQVIALKEMGEVVRGTGPVTIVRDNQQDSIVVTATFEGQDMGSASRIMQSTIDDMITDLNIDTNQYEIKVAGSAEMMNDAFRSLMLAVVLAIVFVYMVMASQFGSFIQPLIIMFSLPLAIIGVVFGLLISGYAFGITAFIGIIILVGIVLNNAIVYIDYTNQLRASGLSVRESLIQAGLTRLRPIIMTALTTMLGLLPLAIGLGEGTEMQAPMAIAVIGGLLSSTVLTLVVIPVIYSLVASITGLRRKIKLAIKKYNEAEIELENRSLEK